MKQHTDYCASLRKTLSGSEFDDFTCDCPESGLTEKQVKHLVDRFLGWHLPENFAPDAGISYTRLSYQRSPDTMPSGTNILDATQADAMVRYMINGMPKE